MTEALWRDAYAREAEGTVATVDGDTVRLDRTVFYPEGGGQPADSGALHWDGGSARVMHVAKDGSDVVLTVDGAPLEAGITVRQVLDWERRWAHMRMHTALHLLSVVIPFPVTGGSIGAEKSRLDFAMPEPLDKESTEAALNELIGRDMAVSDEWVADEDLDEGLVKTLRVMPPRGQGRVRLVRIGDVDLQPCGGTHVATTSEIGRIRIGKVEKKGRENRRVAIHFA